MNKAGCSNPLNGMSDPTKSGWKKENEWVPEWFSGMSVQYVDIDHTLLFFFFLSLSPYIFIYFFFMLVFFLIYFYISFVRSGQRMAFPPVLHLLPIKQEKKITYWCAAQTWWFNQFWRPGRARSKRRMDRWRERRSLIDKH